ncbi:NADH dehydrogenase [ubiquinone] 1 alpha subcomplex subunit 5 [Falco peregrinus]|uniref:NADH dehydrogenase [ubiquinone] 1 alpha subcomplex subunit 5 n=1 Tax=Falco peregrinus TaxID=8954 RepID=UPI002479A707|nr:NADH dehydrogenase [ubiquinone] 1 alpha subcomplex subunit 5 [Falco peregrinus]
MRRPRRSPSACAPAGGGPPRALPAGIEARAAAAHARSGALGRVLWSVPAAPGGCLCPVAEPWRGVLRKTSGLVGLAVVENPHERLRILYTKILGVLQNIPKDAAYRKYTEQIINQQFNLVQTETDVQKLQDKLNSGHIEEVILQAENELSLARKMIQWKPWEPLVEEPPSDQWRWPI